MKALITIKCANGTNKFEIREMAELAEMTRNFDFCGTNYSIEYITELTDETAK